MARRRHTPARLLRRGTRREMRRFVLISLIVTIISTLTAAAAAAVAFALSHVGIAAQMGVTIWTGVGVDALLIYAVFDRRAPIFGRIISRGRPRAPAIAITFDDGPTEPYTSQILDVLREFRAPATFFVLGARAE